MPRKSLNPVLNAAQLLIIGLILSFGFPIPVRASEDCAGQSSSQDDRIATIETSLLEMKMIFGAALATAELRANACGALVAVLGWAAWDTAIGAPLTSDELYHDIPNLLPAAKVTPIFAVAATPALGLLEESKDFAIWMTRGPVRGVTPPRYQRTAAAGGVEAALSQNTHEMNLYSASLKDHLEDPGVFEDSTTCSDSVVKLALMKSKIEYAEAQLALLKSAE